MESIKVTVNSDFKPYINRACVRLNYLYPEVSFKEGKEDISYSLLENTEIDKKIRDFAIDFLNMRHTMLSSLSKRKEKALEIAKTNNKSSLLTLGFFIKEQTFTREIPANPVPINEIDFSSPLTPPSTTYIPTSASTSASTFSSATSSTPSGSVFGSTIQNSSPP